MLESFFKKNDLIIQRLFEIIPGLLLWILLLSPIWGGFYIPSIIANGLVILSVYWLYKTILTFIGSIVGFIKYKKAINTNWLNECLKLKKTLLPNQEEIPKDLFPKQLIVIANYGEDYNVLSRSIRALTMQNYPAEKIYLAVSIENRKAKKDPDYAKRGEYLNRDFGDFFGDRLMFFSHPDDIPGEAIGAAANRTWGTRNSVDVLEARGENLKEFLITAPDGDLVLSKEYLASLTYKWLVSEKRNQKFFQPALYTFNNNYWDVPMLVRILMLSITIPVLASSTVEKHKRETWSCYTLNLQVMKNVNYWDTSLAIDDTPFYWRPYFYFNGDWTCEIFFVSLSADAIYHPSYFKNHIDQYKQYLRWGWGIITFPLALKLLIVSRKINNWEKLSKIFHLFEVFILGRVISFLLAFGIPILLLISTNFNKLTTAYYIPATISQILSVSFILIIPGIGLKMLIIPPKPKNMSNFKYLLILIIEAPMNILVLFTFSFIPFIEASTRMMLGQDPTKRIKWADKQLATA